MARFSALLLIFAVFLLSVTCSDRRAPSPERFGKGTSAVTWNAPLIGVGEFPVRMGWGGRGVAVEINPGNSAVALAGTETGGLFKSTDGFATWKHVDELSHMTPQGWLKAPSRIADLKYTRADGQWITVTTHNDVTKSGGIWRSLNGGTTWTHEVAQPTCVPGARVWGIASASDKTFVASDCGVYVATGSGPFTLTPVSSPVYAVLARISGGNVIVDSCGQDGHRRSVDSGTTYSSAHPGPYCLGFVHGIDGPSNDTNVVLAAVIDWSTSTRSVLESDQGGASGTWSSVADWVGGIAREPWVKVIAPPPPAHQSTGARFDLWFGDSVGMSWVTCKTSGSPKFCPYGTVTDGGPPLAPPWQNVPESQLGNHRDINGIAVHQGCPKLMVSDGGVFVGQNCGTNWTGGGAFTNGVHGGFNALQIYDVNGQIHPTWPSPNTDFYFTTHDNWLWVSKDDNGYSWAGWPNEGHSLSMRHSSPSDEPTMVGLNQAFGTFVSNAHFTNAKVLPNPPNIDRGTYPAFYVGSPASSSTYVLFGRDATTNKTSLYSTTPTFNAGTFTVPWQMHTGGIVLTGGELIDTAPPKTADGFAYVATARPNGTRGLLRARQSQSDPNHWVVERADNGLTSLPFICPGFGTFLCTPGYGVNPSNGGNLLAPDVGTGQMKSSWDGGDSWQYEADLTLLLSANSQLPLSQGPLSQVYAIAWDPASSNRVLVGTESMGIMSSIDAGTTWSKIPGSERIPSITSFFFDEFRETILVSSYGRGLWTIQMPILFDTKSVMRSNRKGDWQSGFFKAECGDNETLIGVSKRTTSRWSHGALCRPSNINAYPHTTCTVRDFSAGESRGTTITGDWDPGYYKGECAINEYAAGVSQATDGSIKSILCCQGTVAHQSCARVIFESGEGHEDGSNPDWDVGYYKGDCGAGRYVGGMSRDLTAQPGAPHALLCCSP